MTYPPQPGGSWPDQQGGWQQQPGGWQDPAGGYASPTSGQPTYVDPVSGQPTYVDPVSGQPVPYPDSGGYAQQQPYPTSPGYAGYPGYPASVMVPTQSTNGMAIASLVVSLVGLVSLSCYGVGGIIGLVGAILGHVGKRQITERGEGGSGMALAGIIIGWITVAIGVAILAFLVFAVWWVSTLPSTYPTTRSTY
jgi:hypothetical protein